MSYIGNSPAFATQIPYRYTIAGSAKTTITGADDLGKALTYTPGYVAVYVNGVKLIDTQDYAATTGSSVVFVNAVQVGDTVEIIAYGVYSVFYAYRASATAPPNPNIGDLWYDLSTGILAIYINDGTTSAWIQIAPTGIIDPATSQFLRNDAAQTMTAAQQTQVRQNIAAVPLDALAYSGMQINGSCQVSQELGTTALAVTNGYVVDGWVTNGTGTYAISSAQVADGPSGILNSLKSTVTTAQTSLGTNDYLRIIHRVEGYRGDRLGWGFTGAQPMSIGFWSKIHRPGTYVVAVRNGPANRSYIAPFTHNVADVWEWKTITIPGDTVGGSTNWNPGTAVFLGISFVVAAGTAHYTTANTWMEGGFLGVAGMTNGIAATSDTFQITGLIVVPGIELPSATRSPFIMRSYDEEKLLCLRYFIYRTFGGGGLWTYPIDLTSGYRRGHYQFTPEMRIAPAVTVTGVTTGAFSGAAPTATNITPYSCELTGDLSGAGYSYFTSIKADARL